VLGEALRLLRAALPGERLVDDVPGVHAPRVTLQHRPDVGCHQHPQRGRIGRLLEIRRVRRVDDLAVDEGVPADPHVVGAREGHQLVGLAEVVAVALRVDRSPLHLDERRDRVELPSEKRRVAGVGAHVAHHDGGAEPNAGAGGQLAQRRQRPPRARARLGAGEAVPPRGRAHRQHDESDEQEGQRRDSEKSDLQSAVLRHAETLQQVVGAGGGPRRPHGRVRVRRTGSRGVTLTVADRARAPIIGLRYGLPRYFVR